MCAKVFGIGWPNASRIVFVKVDAHHYGFAYGTLPNHIQSSEELFQITRDGQGDVYYTLTAFSRPRFWVVRFIYPLSHYFQKKFIETLAKS